MREGVKRKRIPIAGPSITQKEIDYVTDAVANAWYEDANTFHERFERAFAEYLGLRYSVSLPSCTSAIHLSLLAFGVGPGDEVIVPDLTWIATAAPISYVGAVPVFADVDARSWCLTARAIEECVTPRTKAVIPVDLYGSMPDYAEIRQVAESHGLAVIEDAAEAVGSEYRGQKAGTLGDTGTFSFHGSKTLTTGEGGMLVTDRKDVLERVLFLRDHARTPGDTQFQNTEIGYKYKMSSMQAALGLAQTERVSELVDRKREIFSWYRSELASLKAVTLNDERPGTRNSYWMVTAIIDPERDMDKVRLGELLGARNIDTRPVFHPLSSLSAYAHLAGTEAARERNKTSYAISPYGLNLPSGLNLERDDVRFVCDALREVL